MKSDYFKTKKFQIFIIIIISALIIVAIINLISKQTEEVKPKLFMPPNDNLQPPDNFLKCNSNDDCILGDKCGQICYNKNFQDWYGKNIGFCLYKVFAEVKCGCNKNLCETIKIR